MMNPRPRKKWKKNGTATKRLALTGQNMNEKTIEQMELISRPSISATILALRPGQSLTLSFDMVGSSNSLRNRASLLGEKMGRSYSVHSDRETRTYTVTRNS